MGPMPITLYKFHVRDDATKCWRMAPCMMTMQDAEERYPGNYEVVPDSEEVRPNLGNTNDFMRRDK